MFAHHPYINDKNGSTPAVDREVMPILFQNALNFNRFGKIMPILKQNEKWDGTYLGKSALETDYWFVAEFIENQGKEYKRNGHFSLKLK